MFFLNTSIPQIDLLVKYVVIDFLFSIYQQLCLCPCVVM